MGFAGGVEVELPFPEDDPEPLAGVGFDGASTGVGSLGGGVGFVGGVGVVGVELPVPDDEPEPLGGVGFDGGVTGVGSLGAGGGGVGFAGGVGVVGVELPPLEDEPELLGGVGFDGGAGGGVTVTVCGARVTGPTVTLLETSLACQVVYSAASMAWVAAPRLVLL